MDWEFKAAITRVDWRTLSLLRRAMVFSPVEAEAIAKEINRRTAILIAPWDHDIVGHHVRPIIPGLYTTLVTPFLPATRRGLSR